MAFGTDSIVAYMTAMEAATLDKLCYYSTSVPIAGGYCLYGRNSGGNPPTTPTYRDSNDRSTLVETYACTGYGSPQALRYMVKRHAHTNGYKFLARWTQHWIGSTVRNWLTHNRPPGEDTIHEPNAPLNPKGKGDTDPHRHIDAYGHCQILIDSDFQTYGLWNTDAAYAAARIYKDWIWLESKGIGTRKHIREYLRWGNRLNTLAGCYDVFSHYGYSTDASETIDLGKALVLEMYPNDWMTATIGTGSAGTETYNIWNYGDLEQTAGTGDYHDPFNYGFRRFTSQAWYDGHQVLGLYNLSLRMLQHSSGSSTVNTGTFFTSAVEANDRAFQKCVAVVDAITKWYSYTGRLYAPLGDFTASDSADGINAKSQGFKYNTATVNYTLLSDGTLHTIGSWNDLAETTTYIRAHTIDYHESDGLYFQALYADPNSMVHKRWHKTYSYMRIKANGNIITGYNTDGTAYGPDFEVAGNNYLVADMLWIRANMNDDDDERDWARINMFDYLAFANTTNASRSKSQRMSTTVGWSPTANGMQYARQWHWAIQCGHLIRNADGGTADFT